MNKWQVQYSFWSGFGIPAYEENASIDEDSEYYESYPYLTYEAFSGMYDQVGLINVSLWYQSTSLEEISLKADEIGAYIGEGITVPFDDGVMWVHKSNTTRFAQTVESGYDSVKNIKRINLSVEVEFLSL